jgi:hypothetical protein
MLSLVSVDTGDGIMIDSQIDLERLFGEGLYPDFQAA